MDRGGFAPQRGVHLWCDPVQGRLCFLTSNPGVWGLAGAMPGWAGAQGWVHPPPSQCPCELGQAGPEHALWAARTWCSPMAEGDLMFSQGKKHSGPEQGPRVAGAQGRKCDGRDTGQGSGHSSHSRHTSWSRGLVHCLQGWLGLGNREGPEGGRNAQCVQGTCPTPICHLCAWGPCPVWTCPLPHPPLLGTQACGAGLSGHCRHVCPRPPATGITCALQSHLVGSGTASPVWVVSLCVSAKTALWGLGVPLPGRGCAGLPGGLERRPCPERGPWAVGNVCWDQRANVHPIQQSLWSFLQSFPPYLPCTDLRSPLCHCVPLTCSFHLRAPVLSITYSSPDVSSAVPW